MNQACLLAIECNVLLPRHDLQLLLDHSANSSSKHPRVGVIIAIASLPTFFAAGFMWLPLLLIGAGLYLGWGRKTP